MINTFEYINSIADILRTYVLNILNVYNTLELSEQNGHHLADSILKYIFLSEDFIIWC